MIEGQYFRYPQSFLYFFSALKSIEQANLKFQGWVLKCRINQILQLVLSMLQTCILELLVDIINIPCNRKQGSDSQLDTEELQSPQTSNMRDSQIKTGQMPTSVNIYFCKINLQTLNAFIPLESRRYDRWSIPYSRNLMGCRRNHIFTQSDTFTSDKLHGGRVGNNGVWKRY